MALAAFFVSVRSGQFAGTDAAAVGGVVFLAAAAIIGAADDWLQIFL
jgi:hypothetical protein